MFENIIEKTVNTISASINQKSQYVYLYELIFNQKIPQAYKSYFTAEVDWWIYEEQLIRNSAVNFKLDDPKIQTVFKQLDTLYKNNARFDRMEIVNVINNAVKARFNYVCRPRTALRWFVYRWEQSKPYFEIIKRMNFLSDYSYFAELLPNEIKRLKNNISDEEFVSLSDFESIINKIDNNYISKLNQKEFTDLLNPMFEIFNQNNGINYAKGEVPVEALILFLDDKNLNHLSAQLIKQLNSSKLTKINKSDIINFFNNSLGENIENTELNEVNHSDEQDTNVSEIPISEDNHIDVITNDIPAIADDTDIMPVEEVNDSSYNIDAESAETQNTNNDDVITHEVEEPDTDNVLQMQDGLVAGIEDISEIIPNNDDYDISDASEISMPDIDVSDDATAEENIVNTPESENTSEGNNDFADLYAQNFETNNITSDVETDSDDLLNEIDESEINSDDISRVFQSIVETKGEEFLGKDIDKLNSQSDAVKFSQSDIDSAVYSNMPSVSEDDNIATDFANISDAAGDIVGAEIINQDSDIENYYNIDLQNDTEMFDDSIKELPADLENDVVENNNAVGDLEELKTTDTEQRLLDDISDIVPDIATSDEVHDKSENDYSSKIEQKNIDFSKSDIDEDSQLFLSLIQMAKLSSNKEKIIRTLADLIDNLKKL